MATLSEAALRRVLLVRAFESGADDHPQWTLADRAWATQLAREATPAAAPAERFLDDRAGHALQRLAPRDVGVARALASRGWRGWWLWATLLPGLALGLAIDAIGGSQRINLLAPPVWGVIAWNLLVYLALLLSPFVSKLLPVPHRIRAALTRRLAGQGGAGSPMARFHAAWASAGAPLLAARAALLLHVAASALALGLIGGMYLRGLVLDYRAGWQSTFLDAEQVHTALAALLAPAVAVTGIVVPDTATLRSLREGPESLRSLPEALPVASAAPWIHLYAAMLALFVVGPRAVLAVVAAARAGLLSRRLPVALSDPYFQRLLREQQGRAARVQVLPYGGSPSPHALACLRTVLAPSLGSGVVVDAAAATAYGGEDGAVGLTPDPATTLRLALVDLGATPEDDSHGAFVRALRRGAPALPLLVLADETAFRARFASLPLRLAERRAVWQRWAQTHGLPLVGIDLAQPDMAAAERDLQRALQAGT